MKLFNFNSCFAACDPYIINIIDESDWFDGYWTSCTSFPIEEGSKISTYRLNIIYQDDHNNTLIYNSIFDEFFTN